MGQKLENKVSPITPKNNSKSYAQITKNSIKIKPKDANSTPTDIKKTIINTIKPQELGIAISKITTTRDGAIIDIKNEEDAITLQNEISSKLSDLVTTKTLPLKMPKLILYNVEEDLKNEELVECIKKQNHYLSEKNSQQISAYKICFEIRSKREGSKHVVIEVDPYLRNLINDKDNKLNIGWRVIHVADFIAVKRCFNCYGFNHSSKKM